MKHLELRSCRSLSGFWRNADCGFLRAVDTFGLSSVSFVSFVASSTDSSDFNHGFHGWAQIQKDKDPNCAFLWDGCVGFSRKEAQEKRKKEGGLGFSFCTYFSPFCG